MPAIVKRFLFITALVFSCCFSFAQLQITPETNPQALAQKLVGGGVSISNVTITGSSVATAFFKNIGGTQLGLDSGIVLTSGRVLSSAGNIGLDGPQTQTASVNNNSPGDIDLSALVAPRTTNNAVILEFDFVPLGDTVRFRYVFSSDEYPQFNCSNYNDVFAFFISGPGITGRQNLALVPGTNIPVAINSINNGVPGGNSSISTCNAMGAGSPFTRYYVDNSGNQYFTHNGHTKVLTAVSRVEPCQTYHLKIAIADVSDPSYDSGVFIEAESLKSDPIQFVNSLPLINGQPYLVEGCQPGVLKISRNRISSTPQPVQFAFGGTAINGVDVQTLPSFGTIPANDSLLLIPITPIVDNIPEGIEYLKVYISNALSSCAVGTYLDSITIQIRDYDTLMLSTHDTTLCKNNSLQLTATGNFSGYQWSPATGLNNPNIGNPLASPLVNTVYTVNAGSGTCQAKDSVKIWVKSLQLLSKTDVNCRNGTTGQIKVSGGRAWNSARYSINNGAYGVDSTFSNLPVGNYVIKVRDASGCVDSVTVSIVQTYPDLLLADSVVTASCNNDNGKIFFNASGGRPDYTYSIDSVNFLINPVFTVSSGSYRIFVKDANGCVTPRSVTVGRDSAIQFVTHPNQPLCRGSVDGYLLIDAHGGDGNYSYSIDGTNFQTIDSFYVNIPNVTVTVKDDKGCSASQSVTIPINEPVFVNAGNDTTICEGSSVQFNTVYNAANFSWTGTSLSNTSIANPTATPSVTTTYYVTATKDVCIAHDTITVNVWSAPIANAGVDSAICIGRTIVLNGSGGVGYAWSPASLVSDPSSPTPTIKPAQTSDLYLKVIDVHGCSSLKFDTVRITVTPAVQAFAGRDTAITIGQPLQLKGVDLGNSGVTIYQWSPSFGLSNANIANPIATIDHDMTYTLKLITPEGCEGEDVINVKVYKGPEIYVPSAFTPDGNGRNDILRVIPVGIKELKYFRVYNRWGQIIFSTISDAKGWDGTINGKQQPTGVYIWIAEGIDYKGNLISRKGSITLIR